MIEQNFCSARLKPTFMDGVFMEKIKPWLGNPAATMDIVKKYGIYAKKKFGQNFLVDTHVLERIVDAAELTGDDFVLEIGPGIGTLTQYLAYNAGRVLAVEIDKSLLDVLNETTSGYDNVEILNEDILKVDLTKIAETMNDGKPIKIAANLPYYITTPIIMGILESGASVSSMTFMVQKEVAERMAAKPGGKDYGALSLAVQYYCETELNANVPPNCFMPRPEVYSAVITLKPRAEKIKVSDEKLMFKLIKAAFSQRRKTLSNCLRNSPEFRFSKEQAVELLGKAGLDINIRGEALSLDAYAHITDILKNIM